MNHILENHFLLAIFASIGVATFWAWVSTLVLDAITMRYAYLVRKTYLGAKLEPLILFGERLFHIKADKRTVATGSSPLEAWRTAWKRIKLEEKLPK